MPVRRGVTQVLATEVEVTQPASPRAPPWRGIAESLAKRVEGDVQPRVARRAARVEEVELSGVDDAADAEAEKADRCPRPGIVEQPDRRVGHRDVALLRRRPGQLPADGREVGVAQLERGGPRRPMPAAPAASDIRGAGTEGV